MASSAVSTRRNFACDVCSRVYGRRCHLLWHQRMKHGMFLYNCEKCDFGSNTKLYMVRHFKEVHNFPYDVQSKKKKYQKRIMCPICKEHVNSYKKLELHLNENHDKCLQKESYLFSNMSDFYEWKKKIEADGRCQYIAITKERKLKHKKCIRKEYVCHRSYPARTILQTRKRSTKSLGTNKIGVTCPSRMIVDSENLGQINVTFLREHVGHECEIIRTRIPKEERAKIADKMKEGVSVERVLQDIRNTGTTTNFDRIHYAEKKDIYNIMRDFKIGHYMARYQSDDYISIDILTQKLLKHDDSPILHYVNRDDEFGLIIMTEFQKVMLREYSSKICVDNTHGIFSKKPRIQLFTLFTIDELCHSLPVAFYFSSRADLAALNLFFTKIKEAVGELCQSDIFMSDDDHILYEAWKQVVGPAKHRQLSWWHINKNWVKNIHEKIKVVRTDENGENCKIDGTKKKTKTELVQKTLQTLATCIENEDVFECHLQQFLINLQSDPDTEDFYVYFATYYVPRKEEWAFCFREYAGINVNMALENLHQKIKYIYLEGKQCTSLDKSIPSLLFLIRDFVFNKVIKVANDESSEKISRIKKAHLNSLEIKDEDVIIDKNNVDVCYINSKSEPKFKYEIKQNEGDCPEQMCILRCLECNVCIHRYKCTCIDNVVYLNICKHIHKVDTLNNNTCILELQTPWDREVEISQSQQFLNLLTEEMAHAKEVEEMKDKLQIILGYVNQLDQIPSVDYKKILSLLNKTLMCFQKPVKNENNSKKPKRARGKKLPTKKQISCDHKSNPAMPWDELP